MKIEINAAEEVGLVDAMKKEALRKCDPVIQEYVKCARGRLFSVAWACRQLNRDMNACLSKYTDADSLDRFKLEYVQEKRRKQAAGASGVAGPPSAYQA